jgi:hypothetical protein
MRPSLGTAFNVATFTIPIVGVVKASGRDRWGIQPRVAELLSAKSVVDSGRRRTNPSGREVIVWVVAEHGAKGGAA